MKCYFDLRKIAFVLSIVKLLRQKKNSQIINVISNNMIADKFDY